eukprot:6046689-Pleurochrysis_carterae.AAC.1
MALNILAVSRALRNEADDLEAISSRRANLAEYARIDAEAKMPSAIAKEPRPTVEELSITHVR